MIAIRDLYFFYAKRRVLDTLSPQFSDKRLLNCNCRHKQTYSHCTMSYFIFGRNMFERYQCTVVELYIRRGWQKCSTKWKCVKLSYFFTFGKWKKIHHVQCVCTQYSLHETVISTKNHQKRLIFRFLELLKYINHHSKIV